jgi:TonB-linked SusC/RagA family outer membrane protein
MGKRFFTALLALLLIGVQAFAQSAVSGKVTDESGEPCVGANVLIKGTTTGTMTDLDGNYSLPHVKQGSILVFSSIGYSTQEVKVGTSSVINVVLQSDNRFLDEVVVVAYGTQKKKDVTGSITDVKSDIVAIQNTTTVSRALEGAAPGLQVSMVDGQPGYDMAIRLRGVSSTNGASAAALVVIDGVAQQTNSTYENPLSQLDPNDIASVTVLKDAASTALYGSRAGNGVILITTKRGSEGKSKISFQSRWGWNSIGNYNVNSIDTAAEYYEYAWQSIYNSYRYGVNGTGLPGVDANGNYYTNIATPNHTDEEARLFASQHLFDYNGSETQFQKNALGNNMAYNVPGAIYTPTGSGSNASATMSGAYLVDPVTGKINKDARLLYNGDAADIMFKKAFRYEYNLSASGGSDKIHYYASLGYQDEPSFLIASSYKRYSGRMNVDAQALKWLKIGANVGYSKTSTRAQAGKWGSRQIGGAYGNAMLHVKGWQPIEPVYTIDKNGDYVLDANGDKILNTKNASYSPLGVATSPYGSDFKYIAETNIERQDISTWTTRLFADVNFLKYFNFNVNFNMDESHWKRTMYVNSVAGRGTPNGGFGIKTYQRRIINTQQILTYNQDFDKHHVDAMLGHEYEDLNRDDLNFGTGYELIPGYAIAGNFIGRYVNAGGENSTTPGFSTNIYRTESYLSRFNYNYDSKYYLSGSLRRDAASKFTKDNRWGTFWSVGAGWRFSEESFLKEMKTWLDNAKLRASYGVTGNSNGLTSYYLNHYWYYAVATWQTSSSGTGVPASTAIRTGNDLVRSDLTWENIHQFDLGLDFSVLRSRITGALDFYDHKTVNSLFNQSVSPLASAGYTTVLGNAAKVRNRGFEIELDADIIRKKDLTLSVGINGTHYRTTLLSVPADQIPNYDETMDLPKGCWTVATEDMAQAGTASHAGRGIFYLRGEGKDLFNLYMPKYAGVDEKSGLPLYWHRVTYYDVNMNETTGVYEHGGRYANYKVGDNVKTDVAADASYYEVGSATPDWIGGLTLSLKWKDFDFSVVSAYQIGGKFFSMEYSQHLFRGSSMGRQRIPVSKDLVGNTWNPDNTSAYYPMQWFPSSGASSYYLDGSLLPGSHNYTDMSLFDASYFRVKNVTIGYTLPKKLTKKVNISALRAFVSADNVLIFSQQKGVDPTFSTIGGKEVDTFIYPQMQTLTIGLNLDF